MKYLTIIIAFLFCVNLSAVADADNLPNGFRGLEWGDSVSRIKNKKNIVLVYNKYLSKKDMETETYDYFDGITEISGIKIVGPIRLSFYKDKFYEVYFRIGGYDKIENVKNCNSFLKTCIQLYGTPNNSNGWRFSSLEDKSNWVTWNDKITELRIRFEDLDKIVNREPVLGKEDCSTIVEIKSLTLSKELSDNYDRVLKEQKKAGW